MKQNKIMQITDIIHQLRYGLQPLQYPSGQAYKPANLPAIPTADLGCCKGDAEFNLRAADLVVASDAGQLEELVQSIGTLCHSIGQDSGDPAYSEAAVLLRYAAQSLHNRLGE